jgi:uncharacterized protein (TIGR02284 family)
MSNDKTVTKDLMETLADGRDGYAQGATKLAQEDAALASTFSRLSSQRASFYNELEKMAKNYGDDVEESGSVLASLHRGWMSLKDALSGSSPKGVIDAAEQGEDHAVAAYEKALGEDISADLRTVVQRQQIDVKAAHDEIRTLKHSFSDK